MSGDGFRTEDELHAYYGEVGERAAKKQMDRLDKHCRHFISLSPFFVLATANAEGTDASPRGTRPALSRSWTIAPSSFPTGPETTGWTRCPTS